MRKVVFGMNISVDGCYDHTLFSPDEEIMEYFTSMMQDVDQIVYGRKMYELMFPYWSDVAKNQSGTKDEIEFAEAITAIDKVVFSRTLDSLEGHARIVRDNPAAEIQKLKQQPGKKISIASISLRSQLTALGLIDEFYFVVHPAIIGAGDRFFDGISLTERINLKLVEARVFKSGVLGLHYLKQ